MALKLRLQRHGPVKRPYYRVVVAESSHKRDGRYLEIVGSYDPTKNPSEIKLEEERIVAWLDKGATPSDTVKNLMTKTGILARYRQSQNK